MEREVISSTQKWAEKNHISFVHFSETNSTNNQAKHLHLNEKISLIVADYQTSGRGRRQNQWISTSKSSVSQFLSSWVFKTSKAPSHVLPAQVGLALFKAISNTWKSNYSLKAPNDLFLNDKKVAGILIEVIQQAQEFKIIIGVGLNVLKKPELPTATFLAEQISSHDLTRGWSHFLDSFFHQLQRVILENSSALSRQERQELLIALNLFPQLLDPWLDVTEDASLVAKNRKIHWSEL